MKYPASHKEEIHQKLLVNASEQIRDLGLGNVSVKSVMESEGMTVGGFYAHFDSKDDLLKAAIEYAFATTNIEFYDKIEKRNDASWNKKVIERYLSDYHRDTIALSCPVATLMSEVSRASDDIRKSFENNLKELLKRFEPRVGKTKATGLFALLSGGLLMARSVEDEEYSDEILNNCIKSARALIKS